MPASSAGYAVPGNQNQNIGKGTVMPGAKTVTTQPGGIMDKAKVDSGVKKYVVPPNSATKPGQS